MGLPRFRVTERQVLMWIMACLFLAYGATFLVAIFRQQAEPAVVNQPPRVRRMTTPPTNRVDVRYWYVDFFDPSLMSLPNREGFSQRLWRSGPRAGLSAGDWNIRPAFLAPPVPDGPMVLLKQASLKEAVELIAEKLPATETVGTTGATFAPVVSANSYLSVINGTLGSRTLLSSAILPVVTNDVPLRATRIRLAVAADGAVRFANVERSCGNETVDALALDSCRRLQFAPLSGTDAVGMDDMTWGVARVAWTTVPPASTNGVVVPVISGP